MNIFKKVIRTIYNYLSNIKRVKNHIDKEMEVEREKLNDAARIDIINRESKRLGGIEYMEMLEEKKRICKELGITYHYNLGLIGDYFYDIIFIEGTNLNCNELTEFNNAGDNNATVFTLPAATVCNNFEYYKLIKSNKIMTNNERLENIKKEIEIFKKEKV